MPRVQTKPFNPLNSIDIYGMPGSGRKQAYAEKNDNTRLKIRSATVPTDKAL